MRFTIVKSLGIHINQHHPLIFAHLRIGVEIVLGLVAFYIVLAELFNETAQREVLPLFPLATRKAPALKTELAA